MMSDNKDYSEWTLDELLSEEKKVRKNEIISSVLIGFLIGVIIFGIAKNGFGLLYVFIPIILIFGIIKNSQKQKNNLVQIRNEIETYKQD